MTDKIRKTRKEFTPDQRLEYAKLMVGDKYINQQVRDLSGADAKAVSRWKSQYLAEQRGEVEKWTPKVRQPLKCILCLKFTLL